MPARVGVVHCGDGLGDDGLSEDACSGAHLRLGSRVVGVTTPESGGVLVEVLQSDGSTKTYGARYAICTFSVGVLQRSISNFNDEDDVVAFDPPLPEWKTSLLGRLAMGKYVKLFLRFNTTFWRDSEFTLYASDTPGAWPIWQNLEAAPGFRMVTRDLPNPGRSLQRSHHGLPRVCPGARDVWFLNARQQVEHVVTQEIRQSPQVRHGKLRTAHVHAFVDLLDFLDNYGLAKFGVPLHRDQVGDAVDQLCATLSTQGRKDFG